MARVFVGCSFFFLMLNIFNEVSLSQNHLFETLGRGYMIDLIDDLRTPKTNNSKYVNSTDDESCYNYESYKNLSSIESKSEAIDVNTSSSLTLDNRTDELDNVDCNISSSEENRLEKLDNVNRHSSLTFDNCTDELENVNSNSSLTVDNRTDQWENSTDNDGKILNNPKIKGELNELAEKHYELMTLINDEELSNANGNQTSAFYNVTEKFNIYDCLLWVTKIFYPFDATDVNYIVAFLMYLYPLLLTFVLSYGFSIFTGNDNIFTMFTAFMSKPSSTLYLKFYQNDCVCLQEELRNTQKIIVDLKRDLSECRSDNMNTSMEFQDFLKNKQGEIILYKKSSENAAVLQKLADATINQLEETLLILKVSYDAKHEKIERLERQLKRMNAKETNLVAHLTEIDKLSGEITKSNQALQDQLFSEKRTHNRLKAQVLELTSKNKMFVDGFIETAVNSIKETVLQSGENTPDEALCDKIENLLHVVVQRQFMNETLETKVSELQNKLLETEEANRRYIKDMNDKIRMVEEREKRYQELQIENAHLKSFVEERSRNIFKLETKYKEELEILNDKYLDAQELLESKFDLKGKLEKATKELIEQEKLFTSKKNEWGTEIAVLNLQLTNTKRNYENLLSERDFFREKLNNSERLTFSLNNISEQQKSQSESSLDGESVYSSVNIPEPPPFPNFLMLDSEFMQLPIQEQMLLFKNLSERLNMSDYVCPDNKTRKSSQE